MAKDKKEKKTEKKKAGTVVIRDDCLPIGGSMYLLYKGPNPFSIASKLTGSFQPFFRISSAGWGEPDFRWDTSGEPITFFIKWWVKKGLSAYSTMRFNVIVQGDENSQTKQGRFTLEITPSVEHKFPENWFSKGIFWIYHYLFYNKVRQDYIKRCREITGAYRELLKGEFGLLQSEEGKVFGVHKM